MDGIASYGYGQKWAAISGNLPLTLDDNDNQMAASSHQDTNDSGHQITDSGHQINDSGHQITDSGHQINDSGHQITEIGNKIPVSGYPMDDSGLHMNDSGHQVDDNEQQIDDKEQDPNDSGNQMTDYQVSESSHHINGVGHQINDRNLQRNKSGYEVAVIRPPITESNCQMDSRRYQTDNKIENYGCRVTGTGKNVTNTGYFHQIAEKGHQDGTCGPDESTIDEIRGEWTYGPPSVEIVDANSGKTGAEKSPSLPEAGLAEQVQKGPAAAVQPVELASQPVMAFPSESTVESCDLPSNSIAAGRIARLPTDTVLLPCSLYSGAPRKAPDLAVRTAEPLVAEVIVKDQGMNGTLSTSIVYETQGSSMTASDVSMSYLSSVECFTAKKSTGTIVSDSHPTVDRQIISIPPVTPGETSGYDMEPVTDLLYDASDCVDLGESGQPNQAAAATFVLELVAGSNETYQLVPAARQEQLLLLPNRILHQQDLDGYSFSLPW